jgi:hypothetical protein
MMKLLLSCSGVPRSAGLAAAVDITREFAEHRPWYGNVRSTFDGTNLLLEAESDVSDNGVALMDEFSDCLSAYIREPFDGDIRVESVSPVRTT